MVVEDKEVQIIFKNEPDKTELDKTGEKDKQPMFPFLETKVKVAESQLEVCKSSWITHLLQQNYQMLSSVRDYIVDSSRVKSLLLTNGKKSDQQKYLLRIRCKGLQ